MDLSNKSVIHKKVDGIEFLQFKKLLKFPNLKHGYVIKPQNFKMADISKITENYNKICNILKLDSSKLVKPNQRHTNNVGIVTTTNGMDLEETFKETDGLITNNVGSVLAATNADCIILLCYDPVKNVIANVHSGWKGTVQKIAETTIKKMISAYDCDPKNIICCICPSIRKCHFQVEKEVKDIFENTFNYTNRIDEIIEYKGKMQSVNSDELVDKWTVDTVLINKIVLKDCGLLDENIIDSGICSVCNSNEIHSCRVEGKDVYGLNSAVIGMI